MRLSRGFFRIWLVLSAIWIGLWVYFATPKTYSWLWRAPRYEVEFGSGHQTTFDTSKSHEELVADINEEVTREAERLRRVGQALPDKANPEELLKYITSRNEQLRSESKYVWLVTII